MENFLKELDKDMEELNGYKKAFKRISDSQTKIYNDDTIFTNIMNNGILIGTIISLCIIVTSIILIW